MIYPLQQGTRTPPDLFFINTESCGGGTRSLGLFLMVSIFIGIFGVSFMRRWATRRARETRARVGGMCPSGRTSVLPPKPLVPLFSQTIIKKFQAISRTFIFCTKTTQL